MKLLWCVFVSLYCKMQFGLWPPWFSQDNAAVKIAHRHGKDLFFATKFMNRFSRSGKLLAVDIMNQEDSAGRQLLAL